MSMNTQNAKGFNRKGAKGEAARTFEEIADELNISPSLAQQLHAGAIRKLRMRLRIHLDQEKRA